MDSLKTSQLSPVWIKVVMECMFYPENNVTCKEVYKNVITGEKIMRRFNQEGKLIWTNEYKVLYGRNSLVLDRL